MKKQLKHKLYALAIGSFLTLVTVLLFFLDTTLSWNSLKIVSCITVSIWIFFIPPTILYYAYKSKNSSMNYNISLGVMIGTGCFLGLLIAPIIGIMAYYKNLDEVRDNSR